MYVPPNLNAAQAMAEHQIEVKRLGCGWFCTETNDADAANVRYFFCDVFLLWEVELIFCSKIGV